MARLIVLLALLAGAAVAHASDAEVMARIRAQLDAHPRVRADFEQTRRMADLERPLVARGRMLVWGQSGVLWEIDQPVKSAIVLREDTTVQIDARGRRRTRRAEDDAAAARIGRVMRALLNGDSAALEAWFELTARMGGERWTITVTPRKGPMAAFLKSMQVSGARFVETVTVEEANGDSTDIQFPNHRDAAPLSEQERSLLEVR
jgi:hypothetical protein